MYIREAFIFVENRGKFCGFLDDFPLKFRVCEPKAFRALPRKPQMLKRLEMLSD